MRRSTAVTLLSLGFLILIGTQPALAARYDVLAGSDYFVTQPGTTFGGVAFNGVPSGPGNTDTIVQRQDTVLLGTGAPASGSTPLLMTQLQLVSAVPTDFGLGVGLYYITLQSARGGPATVGNMTINLNANDDNAPLTPEGTFSSFFDVFFDVRLGSTSGPIAMSSALVLTNSGANWDANPAPSDLLVPGLRGDVTANLHTNKIQNVDIHDMDFFAVGAVIESHPTGAQHVVTNANPEPGSLALVSGALLFLLLRRRLRH